MAHSLIEGKKFYCREWVFSKLWHCLETLQHRGEDDGNHNGRNGILIVGGPGAGKTAICSELVNPSSSMTKHRSLKKRLLAYHFCQSHDSETLSLVHFIHRIAEQLAKSPLIPGYLEKLGEENLRNYLESHTQDPDTLFKKIILFPLLEIERPKQCSFILVDSIDEIYNAYPNPIQPPTTTGGASKTIGELLGNHSHLLPNWLILICTARKQSKTVARMFTGYRKISLDDLRKSQVVRDVQQYILSRLDQDYSLRQHISRETAEMLNQLHIKSNGCFLYLEKVLDGISSAHDENFIVLREIKEIPGTLNGLFLWLCQRLFTKKQFNRVQLILGLILASPKPLYDDEIFVALRMRNSSFTREDLTKRLHILRRVLIKSPEGYRILFHHSFAEWLLDVKYCTQKYLCKASEGHSMLVAAIASEPPEIDLTRISLLAHHLIRLPKTTLDQSLYPLLILSTGATLSNVQFDMQGLDPKVIKLLELCDVKEVKEIQIKSSNSETFEGGGEAPCEEALEDPSTNNNNNSNENDNKSEDAEESEANILKLIGDINQVDYNQRTPLHNAANEGNIELVNILIKHKAHLETVDKHGRTPLNLAARQGHENVVEVLLSCGAQYDHADKDGWTPLRSAAWAGSQGVVDTLLAKGAEVDLTDADGRTALRAAAWGGHEEVVTSLLKAGASPSLADNEGRTSLIAAAYMGHAEIVEKLLSSGANVNHSDSDGRTALSVAALCVAASQGHLRVVTLLLERNAAVDHQDKDGTTPLLVASFEGHKEVCELLLEYEADIDAADKAARTPLWASASMGHAAVAELLLFWGAFIDHIDGEGRTVLSVSAAQGNVGVVRLLLARGLDEGHRDNAGWTPLHYSSFEGHQEVTEALLEAGARINDIDNDGKHPLLLSSQEGHINVVESLLNYGAFIDQRSHDGRTALRAAAIEGYKDIVQLLISRGADVNYRDADGRSTLYLLALENRFHVAQFILRNGADCEARDLEGRTPLHVSAWQGHIEMVELLVSAGAQVNATDNDKRTPLQSSSWQGHSNIVRLLCERGSKIDHTCNQGATALCIAAQEGHYECVKVLVEYGANVLHCDGCGRTPLRVSLKSGHTSISRLLEATVAKNKTLYMGASNLWEDSFQGDSLVMNKPSNPNHRQLQQQQKSVPFGYYGENNTSPEVEKRRSLMSQDSSGAVDLNFEQKNPKNNGNHQIYSKKGSLSFTQQVEQVSRGKGRPISRILSPLAEPHSPIYASPPQSPSSESVNDEKTSPNMSMNLFSGGNKIFNGSNTESYNKSDESRGKSSSSASSQQFSNNHESLISSFAFSRDSHMKIILSKENNSGKNRKNGIVNGGNSGLSSATNAIRSGLNALKAGVLEAAAGKKSHHDDSPLVSAASMAVPSMQKPPRSNSGGGIPLSTTNSGTPWKKETPL